jgi:hypothetical protein
LDKRLWDYETHIQHLAAGHTATDDEHCIDSFVRCVTARTFLGRGDDARQELSHGRC